METFATDAPHGAQGPQPPIRCVIFDFDGTLARTSIDFGKMKDDITRIVRGFLPDHPAPGTTPALEWAHDAAMRLDAGDSPLGELLRTCVAAAIRHIEMDAASRGEPFAFTRPMLSQLRGRGVGVAIITRNCTEAVETVLPDARSLADVLLSRDDVRNVKPHPEHALAAMAALGALPAHTIVVGDHPLDIETGQRAGTATAGVLTGNASREQFLACGADLIANDAAALIETLARDGRLATHPGTLRHCG
ncbi:phosphoglycolate phosphatase [Desulfobaculum xiamenense]|uniref:phosphoglycolate phosphatase n=1 Tax=Desulfobaculum xiamenense TaxID=995050 RepID=A0A846QJH0_9BACT|nr:HAD-IA family hydrolase [Desulfobaculum xiamenense]NJB69016.1 phosphoglycolate phosphatase [Desulfobaculum xiamenense]